MDIFLYCPPPPFIGIVNPLISCPVFVYHKTSCMDALEQLIVETFITCPPIVVTIRVACVFLQDVALFVGDRHGKTIEVP